MDSALGEALRQAAGNARPLNAGVQAKLIRSYLLSEEETAYRGVASTRCGASNMVWIVKDIEPHSERKPHPNWKCRRNV